MSLKAKFILVGLVLCGLLAVGLYILSAIDEVAMRSCVWSLETPVRDSLSHGISQGYPLSNQWKTLGSDESAALLSDLVIARQTDCGRIENMKDSRDIWGNSIKIAVRESAVDGTLKVKVWSNGPDGQEQTDDDLMLESPESQR